MTKLWLIIAGMFVTHGVTVYTGVHAIKSRIYQVDHKKRPQLGSDVVRLISRIQTKRNDSFKEQSQLNSMRNYDFIRFCFNSEIHKKVLDVRTVQNNQ